VETSVTPEEAKEIIERSDRRFKNLVKAIENYNIHIDVICHDYVPSPNEVAISHTLTSSCNPKKIVFAYDKKHIQEMKGGDAL
jgi:hypothetical protein